MLSRRSLLHDVLKSRVQTSGGSENAHFQVYDFIPHVLHTDPLFGLGLNTFSVYYEFVTGKTNWGPHCFYVALIVETGLVGTALFALFLLLGLPPARAPRARSGARSPAARDPLAARVRPLAWGCTAALVGTLASNAFYLTMQFYYFYAFVALALAIPVVFAQTANEGRRPDDVVPAPANDVAGTFVAASVEACARCGRRGRRRLAAARSALRHRATAAGSRRTCARAPWKLALVPRVPRGVRASPRDAAARDADLVHAHWIPSALAARATGKPYVLQVWGTDVELARRAPRLVRPLVRGARVVIAASSFLADEARALGAREVASSRPASRSRPTSASRTSRRTSSSPGASARRRGSSSSSRRPRDCRA